MRISDWISDVCSSDLLRGWNGELQRDRLREVHRDRLPAVVHHPRDERAHHVYVRRQRRLIEDGRHVLNRGDPQRSEERRVGKECVSTCIYRRSTDHYQKNKTSQTTSTHSSPHT